MIFYVDMIFGIKQTNQNYTRQNIEKRSIEVDLEKKVTCNKIEKIS